MRIALSSYSGYGFWFALRLMAEGHDVDIYLSRPEYANILSGLIPTPFLPNGNLGYARYPDYSKYDLSLFDLTGRERQAEFSALHCPTIGDGAFHCAIEDDRCYGINVMEECGIQVPPYEEFDSIEDAKKFIKNTGKKYVFKPSGGQEQDTATTYVADDADDMVLYLDKLDELTHGAKFVLQEFVAGTEVSTEAWFNGEDFYLINSTLEEKKFMNDNKGPSTGCSGNLVFIYGGYPKIFTHGLGKMASFLRSVNYTGMIDLNTIVTDQGIYGLEYTPRFGYDSLATLLQLYAGNFGEMLRCIATGDVPEISWRAEYAAGVRVSIPPYPSEFAGKHPHGIAIQGINEHDFLSTYLFDVECSGDHLISAGHSGFICTPIGAGNSVGEAFGVVCERLKKLKIPNAQWRTDMEKCAQKRYRELDLNGWLS